MEAKRARDRGADMLVLAEIGPPARCPSRACWRWEPSIPPWWTPDGGTPIVLVESGDAFDVHAVAMLLAAGADAVHPWHAVALARGFRQSRGLEELTQIAEGRFLDALEHGLRKVLARMGISTLASYRSGRPTST